MADNNNKKILSKKDVRKCYWSWMFWNLSVQNMERMQAPAIIRMLGIVKDKFYPNNKEQQKELLERHKPFFNTEPYVGSIVPGIVLGMEEEKAKGNDISPDLITGVKTALMGPFAGIGDSLMPGTLIPILLSIGLGISKESGSVLGPLFYAVAFLGIMLPLTWFLFNRGYKMGVNAAQYVLSGGIKDKITNSITIIGIMVAGAISAMYVNLKTGLVFTSGEMSLDLNNVLEGLFPNLLTLLLGLVTYYLIAKKKMSMGKVFLIYLALAVIGYFSKLLA